MVSDKILIFSLFVGCFYRKGPALNYQLHKVWEINMTFDLDLWPIDLQINRYPLLIKDSLPTYQIWSLWDRAFLSYPFQKVKGDQYTNILTDPPTCRKQYSPPSLKGVGDKNIIAHLIHKQQVLVHEHVT